MKQQAKGKIADRIFAIPNSWYPVYLVQGERKNLMIDAGVNLLGPRYLSLIEEILGDAGKLDYLFITHSHYDHIGSAHYLKRHIPGLKIGAHPRVAGLVRKTSVREVMSRLSSNHPELLKYNTAGEDLSLGAFDVDLTLSSRDEFDLGGLTCRVYETPGHTKDSLSFYIPQIKTLFPSEACGVLQGETGDILQVEFLSSYQDYIDSLKTLISLDPDRVCLAHGWVLTDGEARDFLSRSLAETYRYREQIERYLKASDGDVEKAVRNMTHAEYDVQGKILQERTAYVTNLTAQVKHIASLGKDHG